MTDRFRMLRGALCSRDGRALGAIAGVAMAALLVLLLMAVERSLTSGIRAYAGSRQIDYWVGARGTDNLIRTSSLLPAPLALTIRGLAGVAQASCIARGFAKAHTLGDSERGVTLLVMGYDPATRLGSAPAVGTGRLASADDEVAVDAAAAHRLRARVGDALELGARRFRITAITEHTNLMATQLAFLTLAGSARLAGSGSPCSFVAVKAMERATGLEARLARLSPDIEVHARDDFAANSVSEVMTGFRPFAALLGVIGIATASLLLALLVHGLIERSRRELSVLLALGATLASLVTALLAELWLLILLGVGLAGVLALLLRVALQHWLPCIELDLATCDVVRTAGLFALSCSLAIVPSLLRLLRLDPMEAFRA
jgi:putative ABC transport system permease protein